MNADQFNSLYPVGTRVFAYPVCRPEDHPNDKRLVTRTRSKAEVLGGHTDVVWVEGHGAYISLTHVDVVPQDAWEAALLAEMKRLHSELEHRIEDLAFLERATLPELRRTIQHHQDGKQRWRARAEKAEAERDALQQRLHEAALTKVWVNEDGKRFVFLEDIAPALLGVEPKPEVAR